MEEIWKENLPCFRDQQKGGPDGICDNMDELGHDAKRNEPDRERASHSSVELRKKKWKSQKQRVVVAKGWRVETLVKVYKRTFSYMTVPGSERTAW